MAPRARAWINLSAIERNCRLLKQGLRDDASLCAVVKADGYGHGAVQVAHSAVAGGASWLAVASADEAAILRAGGIATRILVMGALTDDEIEIALDADADVAAWREEFVAALAARQRPARVHVKLDTGMGRLGTRDVSEADRVAQTIADAPQLELSGAWTHFATADDTEDPFFAEQLARFDAWALPLRERHRGLIVHCANSAATLRDPAAHHDLVRCGIAIYGMDPFNLDPSDHGLEPALELCSYVAEVKPCAPGESAGYGRRFIAETQTTIATLPIGYADGVRRDLSNNCEVLVGGRRRPMVGTVSMDNVTLDLGGDPSVQRGQNAILIGADGPERVLAEEWAQRLGTINYEVTCGLSGARVERVYHRDGVNA